MAEGANRSGRFDRRGKDEVKAEMAKKAVRHLKAMDELYAKEIDASFDAVTYCESTPSAVGEPCVPSVVVLDQQAALTVVDNGRGRAQYCDMALIDSASFTSPAGGYEKGARGLEAELCEASFLGNVLARCKDWYAQNRRRHINCELYRNRGMIVPRVRFNHDRLHAYADVVVVAAPNKRAASREYKVDEQTLKRALAERVSFCLALADSTGDEKLVLNAFGCGFQGWDALEVAEAFRAELAGGAHVAKEVFIAVPRSRRNENLAKFTHVFSEFPGAPRQAYASVLAEPAPRREESVEEDEDWRKYLA